MVKPQDICPEVPPQKGVIRVQYCCMMLSQILPNDLYMKVRTAVYQWDADNCPHEEASRKAAESVRARWAK